MNNIYALADPRTNTIRYIGVTKLPLSYRLSGHIRASRWGEKTYKAAWIRELLALNLKPIIKLVEETEDRDRECYWIAKFRADGCKLVNTTDGGEGGNGLSLEARQRISLKLTGRKRPDEVKRRISEAHKGKQIPESAREKSRQAQLGKKRGPLSEETKAKMSLSKKGHGVSEETRKKLSDKMMGRAVKPRSTHCPNGHPYTSEHVFINIRGAQECKTCRAERDRLRYQKQKASK